MIKHTRRDTRPPVHHTRAPSFQKGFVAWQCGRLLRKGVLFMIRAVPTMTRLAASLLLYVRTANFNTWSCSYYKDVSWARLLRCPKPRMREAGRRPITAADDTELHVSSHTTDRRAERSPPRVVLPHLARGLPPIEVNANACNFPATGSFPSGWLSERLAEPQVPVQRSSTSVARSARASTTIRTQRHGAAKPRHAVYYYHSSSSTAEDSRLQDVLTRRPQTMQDTRSSTLSPRVCGEPRVHQPVEPPFPPPRRTASRLTSRDTTRPLASRGNPRLQLRDWTGCGPRDSDVWDQATHPPVELPLMHGMPPGACRSDVSAGNWATESSCWAGSGVIRSATGPGSSAVGADNSAAAASSSSAIGAGRSGVGAGRSAIGTAAPSVQAMLADGSLPEALLEAGSAVLAMEAATENVNMPIASSYHDLFAVIEARERAVQALKSFLASMGCDSRLEQKSLAGRGSTDVSDCCRHRFIRGKARALTHDGLRRARSKLARLIARLRVVTTIVTELIVLWRNRSMALQGPTTTADVADAAGNPNEAGSFSRPPEPFMWLGWNYLLKMRSDLAFLPIPIMTDPVRPQP